MSVLTVAEGVLWGRARASGALTPCTSIFGTHAGSGPRTCSTSCDETSYDVVQTCTTISPNEHRQILAMFVNAIVVGQLWSLPSHLNPAPTRVGAMLEVPGGLSSNQTPAKWASAIATPESALGMGCITICKHLQSTTTAATTAPTATTSQHRQHHQQHHQQPPQHHQQQ